MYFFKKLERMNEFCQSSIFKSREIDFITGYETALSDSKAIEMFELLKSINEDFETWEQIKPELQEKIYKTITEIKATTI